MFSEISENSENTENLEKFLRYKQENKHVQRKVTRISDKSSLDDLNQLKIDYLNFIKQSLRWDENNTISVLFSLLMEQDYLTQDQIMELTGLSRAAVSETLKRLLENSNLPILKTRKQDSKKNYYYTPFSFDQYIRNYLVQSLQTTIRHMNTVPVFLQRLEKIPETDNEKGHFVDYLQITLLVAYYYNKLANNLDAVWNNYQQDSNFKVTLSKEFDNMIVDLDNLVKSVPEISLQNETLNEIKKDFLGYALVTQIPYGRSRELSMIGLIILLEPTAVTQDYLMEFSNYGRSTVSEALTRLVGFGLVEIVKKPNDRKKYYKLKYSLLDYAITRYKESVKTVKGILLMLKNNFIPRIHSLEINEKKKKKYSDFFKLNIHSYRIISEIIELYFTAIYDKLSDLRQS
ncbi:MAG: winged helix-turn-helix transcriptional regulator [Asgard group archaeon]|nr:winged helix-turn-helix transcriptional regulator [Asgard group archaeon]